MFIYYMYYVSHEFNHGFGMSYTDGIYSTSGRGGVAPPSYKMLDVLYGLNLVSLRRTEIMYPVHLKIISRAMPSA